MALTPGARLGSYEIQAVVGAGGMGQVYRARDTRLDRTVAIKVLHEHLTDRADVRERFQREAHTISSLNHPHICALYDIGNQDGIDYLVMEYLKGETLASRLQRGALPVAEALEIAAQMADAIDRAHRQGVIHRDLKPGNVMLTESGPKLLDFGLARQAQPAAAMQSAVPTRPAPLTAEGTILGTLQYMAPEQLDGQEADARTDIFAFGTVLHEMLTGQKAFDGKSHASVIAAIVDRDPPPVSSLAPLSPPLLDQVVRTCLAKDPDRRWQSIADVLIQLKLVADSPAQLRAPQIKRRSRMGWATAAAALLVVGTLLAAAMTFPRAAPKPAKITFELPTPPSAAWLQIAISPRGSHVAAVVTTGGNRRLWVRTLENLRADEIAGTEGANFPFWSADGRSIAFFADGKLKTADLAGAPPRTVCDAPNGNGGTWSRDDVVVFAPRGQGPLFRIPAAGGVPAQVTELDRSRQEITHRYPFFLPDGRHFLYVALSSKAEYSSIYVGSLDSKQRKFLVAADVKAEFAAPDHLLFMRRNTLVASRFDPARLQLEGEPVPVAEGVGSNRANHTAGFAVSGNGTLVLRASGGDRGDPFGGRLQWFDRAGREIGTAGTGIAQPAIAPDLLHVAAAKWQADAASDIWILDLVRGTSTRFTSDSALDDEPVWSPGSSQIVFRSNRNGSFDLYEKDASGIGEERLLLRSDHPKRPIDWSADGRFILYRDDDPETGADLWVLPTTEDKRPIPVVRSPFMDIQARFSPNGRYIAYVSNESGEYQVYIQGFPNPGKRWQISTSRSFMPRWRHDGKELFFLSGAANLRDAMAVDIKLSNDGVLSPGVPHKLFDVSASAAPGDWDVTPDGQRFLVHTMPVGEGFVPLTVILNWANGTPSTRQSHP